MPTVSNKRKTETPFNLSSLYESKRDHDETIRDMSAFVRKISNSKKLAQKFLNGTGIHKSNGTLSENYNR